ncbi:MAG: family 10 glycosylhydrolase [Oscillospiraceae bacterium]|nr:family 10 glycosylhydrolase [Oscillospiraceae bacterium]
MSPGWAVNRSEKESAGKQPMSVDALSMNGIFGNELYRPLNFHKQKAMWFTYMDYENILSQKSEEEFSEIISERFENASELGINTVYVQIRAFGDAYYPSEIFCKGKFYTDESFDPLQIMIDKAHSYGLSFHAWINPMRLMKKDEISSQPKSEIERVCVAQENFIFEYEGRYYLDPSYSDTVDIVCRGIEEIVRNYNVDGIHIDDYFYPSQEVSDADEFKKSGKDNIADWRRENINVLVRSLYNTVKSINKGILFGISPQGNIETDYEKQYADVEKWLSEGGYCDYIVPQIYYGYENSECPFEETLNEWKSISDGNTALIIGLCTYKNGTEDKWAGKGADEWIINDDVTSRQVTDCTDDPEVDGIALYSYSSTFEDEVSSAVMASGQVQQIRENFQNYR